MVITPFMDHIRYLGREGGHELAEHGDYLTLKTGLPHPMGNWVVGHGLPREPATLFPGSLPFLWLSEPWSVELDRALQELGLAPDPLMGVAAPLESLASGAGDPRVSVTDDFDRWCRVAGEVWHAPPSLMQSLFRAYAKPQGPGLLFLAEVGAKEAGCALLHCERGVAGLHWNAVLPQYRGKGLGSALVEARIGFARERGCHTGVAACRDTSLRIFERLGFQQTGALASYLPKQFAEKLAMF
ncbi:MAG: GNAT family N-acetyltransferase [Parachlamydiales bacterium]